MKQTREQLQAERDRLSQSEGILCCALNDVINGGVVWHKSGPYSVGVTRPCAPDGGIALVRFAPKGQEPYTCAYRWEAWYQSQLEYIPATANREGQQLREAAIKANEWVIKQRNQGKDKTQNEI